LLARLSWLLALTALLATWRLSRLLALAFAGLLGEGLSRFLPGLLAGLLAGLTRSRLLTRLLSGLSILRLTLLGISRLSGIRKGLALAFLV